MDDDTAARRERMREMGRRSGRARRSLSAEEGCAYAIVASEDLREGVGKLAAQTTRPEPSNVRLLSATGTNGR